MSDEILEDTIIDEATALPPSLMNNLAVSGDFYKMAFQFQQIMMIYESAIKQVETKLDILNKESSVNRTRNPISTVKSRLKSPESIAKKLEKKGFIEVRPSETDRRRKQIRRTDKARELDRAAFLIDGKTFEKFAAGLDEAQRSVLEQMLDRMLTNICGGEKEGRET